MTILKVLTLGSRDKPGNISYLLSSNSLDNTGLDSEPPASNIISPFLRGDFYVSHYASHYPYHNELIWIPMPIIDPRSGLFESLESFEYVKYLQSLEHVQSVKPLEYLEYLEYLQILGFLLSGSRSRTISGLPAIESPVSRLQNKIISVSLAFEFLHDELDRDDFSNSFTEKRWHAAEEQYQAAEERYQAAQKQCEAAEGPWQAAMTQHKVVVKQAVSTLVLVSRYLQETFEDIRSAFEDFEAASVQLPRVRLNLPPIFLRVAGPITMDLRPFHRAKNMHSFGSMFLESLMCDFWISWDLRSYEVLVAVKIMYKGHLYPTAFTSKPALLVKRLIKANLQFALQSYNNGRQRLALKSHTESTGLGVSTTPMFQRASHDAHIKGTMKRSPMQRSLITAISLGVRNLTSCVTPIGEGPECFGGFADIWKAQLTFSNAKMTVAVKYLRLCITDATKHFYQEIRIWQKLKHPHVLPLLGICHTVTSESIPTSIEVPDPMTSIGIVCPWMENGTLVNFLKLRQTKQENMEELRLRLLIQVCSGLMYLHSKNIVHGDLHSGNVLVDSDGCARLADFGLSTVVAECRGTPRTSPGGRSSPPHGALRWAAPELVLPQGDANVRLHPSADIYSVGGLILQTYTGDWPYLGYNEGRVILAIKAGEKPSRPPSDEAKISDTLWSVIEECWQDDPLKRPTAAALESRLQAIYSGLGDEQV